MGLAILLYRALRFGYAADVAVAAFTAGAAVACVAVAAVVLRLCGMGAIMRRIGNPWEKS